MAGDAVWEAATHREVEQDEVALVAGDLGPGLIADLAPRHRVVVHAVDVPAQFVARVVPLEPVSVEVARARRAEARAGGADAVGLVARAALLDAAVQHAPHLVEPVDVLHDVELADPRPVPV